VVVYQYQSDYYAADYQYVFMLFQKALSCQYTNTSTLRA
jgi:hypothetical protein